MDDIRGLPPEFTKTITSAFGDVGRAWLTRLPELTARAARQWGLSEILPVSNLSYNFVAFAQQDRRDVVLKIGVPQKELFSEIAALQLFNGDGACQLLKSDEDNGAFLLERLKPGTMLAELEDDDARTAIAAEVMQTVRRDIPLRGNFILLSDWFAGLKKIRPRYGGGTGIFPSELLEATEALLPELFASAAPQLIHGDLHHFNVLSAERGWLAIDPKGVIGPAGYEVGPLMINPWNTLSAMTEFKIRADRRAGILSERLHIPRGNILQWAQAHALLSAWWGVEDGTGWEYALACAEAFSKMR